MKECEEKLHVKRISVMKSQELFFFCFHLSFSLCSTFKIGPVSISQNALRKLSLDGSKQQKLCSALKHCTVPERKREF